MKYKKQLITVSAVITSLGICVFFGWVFDIGILKSVLPHLYPMKVNTAVSFILLGISFYYMVLDKRKPLAKGLTVIVLFFSLTSLAQDILEIDLGVDELFIIDHQGRQLNHPTPGRMAGLTAFCLSLMAISMLLVRTKYRSISQYLLHFTSLTSFIAIIGYILDVPTLYKISFLTSMAVHTALAMFILSIGTSLINPNLGLTGVLTGTGYGSQIARKLLPRLLLSLIVLSILRMQSHRRELVDVEFGIALFAVAFCIVGLIFIWDAARFLNKLDSQRIAAENKVIETSKNLEKLVDLRTYELTAILDSALVSIIGTDTNGTITHFNKGAEKLLGYAANEVVGTHTPAIIHDPEEVSKHGKELTKLFNKEVKGFDALVEQARQGKHESKEWTYIRKDGTTFPVQLVVNSIRDKQNVIYGFLGIATDISDLHQARTSLEQLANHLQKQNSQLLNFAHITSHNLRSPVSNLNSLLYLYNESNDTADKALLFGKFEIVINHLTNTLNELVESLKIQEDTGKEKELLIFEDIFKKTREMLAGSIVEANGVITYDFASASQIEYPKAYLESIVLNLFSNALKYRSQKRTLLLHFKTEIKDGVISLKAIDNGLGIDLKKHGTKLFGLNKTFHRHAESKGIGLFITKTQVEAMGGSISAESEVDKGTTFTVIFGQKK
jgi:PAS domain S-box-containing protein